MPERTTLLSRLVFVLLLFASVVKAGPADHAWSKQFAGTGDASIEGIASGFGGIAFAGFFSGSVDFGAGTVSSAGSSDIFVGRYYFGGNHAWSKRIGSSGFDDGRSVAIDASGAVIVTGSFRDTVDFDGDSLASAGNSDIFLVKYDAFGTLIWAKRFGDAESDSGVDVAVDANGNIVLTATWARVPRVLCGWLRTSWTANVWPLSTPPRPMALVGVRPEARRCCYGSWRFQVWYGSTTSG